MSDKDPISRWQMMWLASAWLLVGVVVYLSLARIDVDISADDGDKVGHVFAYAAMTFWFMQVYVALGARCAIAVALVVLGVVLEFLQGHTGYRTFDYADMIANAAGVAAAWIASPPRTPSVVSRIQSYISR